MSQESEQKLQIAENRYQQLPALQELPTTEWINKITTLYPDVINPEIIREDLTTLDQIAEEITKNNVLTLRGIASLLIGGGSGLALSAVGIASTNYILVLPGMGLFLLGFGGGIFQATSGSNSSERANNLANSWNNRGLNWLHQQRARLFGN